MNALIVATVIVIVTGTLLALHVIDKGERDCASVSAAGVIA